MLAESSILELVDTADGVAIAAPVREIADSSCCLHLRSVAAPMPFAPPIGRGSQLPPARHHVHEIAVWCQAAIACEAKPNPAAGGHRF